MKVCPKCGKMSILNSNFCTACGADMSGQPSQEQPAPKEEFIGKIYKCPNCGTEIPSMTAICPGCGIELNSSRTSEGAKQFIERIAECDRNIQSDTVKPNTGWASWSIAKKIGWVILNLYTACIPLLIYWILGGSSSNVASKLTGSEKEKVNVINGYVFPDDRGAILEALMFMENQVSNLSSQKVNPNGLYWMSVWKNKAGQLANKAAILFPGDNAARDISNRIESAYENSKKSYNIKKYITIAVVIVVIALIYVVYK